MLRRRRPPPPPPVVILTGTLETIAPQVLVRARIAARQRRCRLLVIDEGEGIEARHGDPERDLHYDSDLGNWDAFADHRGDIAVSALAHAICTHGRKPLILRTNAACAVADLARSIAREPRPDLGQLATRVRAFEYADLAAAMRLAPDDHAGARVVHAVLAQMHADAGRFAARDPATAMVSLERWLAGDPARILFVTAHAPLGLTQDGACRSVHALLEAVEFRAPAFGTGPLRLPVDGSAPFLGTPQRGR